ncbi:DHX57 [Symbiodinium sp. CCMP2592]|nr:DHX57 [Symbiodinium sp. CCMP2592]
MTPTWQVKRRRENAAPPGLGDHAKGSDDARVTLDMHHMEALLAAQASQIVNANQAQIQSLFTSLETKYDQKFADAGLRFDNVEERVAGVESKLARIEDMISKGRGMLGPGEGDESRRRLTLVFGGWRQDTPKKVILGEVEEALRRLQLLGSTDSAAFTTGPRRSVALMAFRQRTGEDFGDTRRRMLGIVTSLAEAAPMTSHNKKMWCSFSRTKAERDVSGHASWLKRAVGLIDKSLVSNLDVEFSTGTVWCGESMVASATKSPPSGVPDADVMWDEGLVARPWIWVPALARELGRDESHLRQAIEETKR